MHQNIIKDLFLRYTWKKRKRSDKRIDAEEQQDVKQFFVNFVSPEKQNDLHALMQRSDEWTSVTTRHKGIAIDLLECFTEKKRERDAERSNTEEQQVRSKQIDHFVSPEKQNDQFVRKSSKSSHTSPARCRQPPMGIVGPLLLIRREKSRLNE